MGIDRRRRHPAPTIRTLSAGERARLERGHDWVRLVAFICGTGVAVAFSAKPSVVWVVAIAGFLALVPPSFRLARRISSEPRLALVTDLYYAALVAGSAAGGWVVAIAIIGTLVVGKVVLAGGLAGVRRHAVAATTLGVVLGAFVGTGTEAVGAPVALVAGTAVTTVVVASVVIALGVIRQWVRRLQTERDAAQAGIQVAMDVAAVSVMVIDRDGTVVQKMGWAGLPVSDAPAHVDALAGMPDVSRMVADAFDGAEVSASVLAGERVLTVAVAPFELSDGRTAVSLAASDITEPVMAGRRADQASRWKSDFIATVSHEIRTPLTAVLGFLHEANDRVEATDPVAHEYIQIVTDQAQEAADIVEDLLVATRQHVGELSFSHDEVDLLSEARRVVAGLGDRARRVTVEGVPVAAWGDRSRVRQVVRNLVTNALKHGGPRVTVVAGYAGGGASVVVADDGAGISITSRDLVFRPFVQLGERSSPGGFGLGLSVSRDLAAAMGGSLLYHYQDGWSRFTLTLPAYVSVRAGLSERRASRMRAGSAARADGDPATTTVDRTG